MIYYDARFCLQTDKLPQSGSTFFPLLYTADVMLQEHKMIYFFLLTGEKYFPSICSHSCSHFRHHHPRCHISGDVDAAFNKMSSVLARREFAFGFIHIQCKGKLLAWCSYNMRPFCVRQIDKWTAWLPLTVSWSFLLKIVLMNYLHAGSCAVLALDLEAGLCIIMKTCGGVLEQHNHHIVHFYTE